MELERKNILNDMPMSGVPKSCLIQLMKAQEKDLVGSLQTLLVNDLYAALPELKPVIKSLRPRGRLRKHIDQSERNRQR